MAEDLVGILEEATGLGEVIVIVRTSGAIAEVMGELRLRRGEEWLTLGQEGGSHVHLRVADIRGVRFTHSEGRNAALQFLGPGGTTLLQLSFRGTNPRRAEGFNPERSRAVHARFSLLAEPTGQEAKP